MHFSLNYKYGLIAILTIILGLLSRKIDGIPFFIGDVLYAILQYLILNAFFGTHNKLLIAVVALLFCFIIECSQLLTHPILNSIRSTTIGKLVLGQGFLWSDLLAYFIGITVVYIIDTRIFRKRYPV